jgi:hypothetical protein
MDDILRTVAELRSSVKKEDVLIVWGGSNGISKNNCRQAITNLSDFVKNSHGSNVIVINAPHRHDLSTQSCVNKEVAKFNRKMKKVIKLNPNLQLLELELDRTHFTNHGMHMNSKGKDQASQHLSKLIGSISDIPLPSPIPIPWKLTSPALTNTVPYQVNMEGSDDEVATCSDVRRELPQLVIANKIITINEERSEDLIDLHTQVITEDEQLNTSNKKARESSVNEESAAPLNLQQEDLRKSNRTKKAPQTRSDDFLWT